MRKHKRNGILLACLMLGLLTICGCGKSDAASSENSEGNAVYTRGDWIEDLGEKFGYMQPLTEEQLFKDVSQDMSCYSIVQACAEWDVIDTGSDFLPKDEVTWEFAVDSAIRAIGVEKLERAGYDMSTETSMSFFTGNIAQVELADWSEVITKEEAEQVLTYVSNFEDSLVFPQIEEAVFNDGVQELTEKDICLKGDGKTAIVLNDAVYQSGEIIYLNNTVTGEVTAFRVESMEDNILTYSVVTGEEVFESVSVHGTYEADFSEVIVGSAEQTVYFVNGVMYGGNDPYMQKPLFIPQDKYEVVPTATIVEASLGSDSASFKVYDASGSWTAEAGIDNFKVDVNFEKKLIGIKEASLKITYDDYVKLSTELHEADTIPLGELPIQLPYGLKVEVSFFLNIGVDGEASITYTSDVVAEVSYKSGAGLRTKISNNNPTLDFKAQITVALEPLVKADLQWLEQSLLNAKLTTGIVASVNVDDDLLDDEPCCCDIKAYVPFRWAVNEDSCLVTYLFKNAKVSKTVWNSTNSPFQWEWHYEDYVLVEKCTRGEEKVEAPLVTEEGKPLDEYKIFDFEEISFGMIKLISYNMYLEKGETLEIGFSKFPDNISRQDLVYEVVDSDGVCSVDANGYITANAPGATNVKISTEDGKYNAYLTVIVAEDYHDTSSFVPLQ